MEYRTLGKTGLKISALCLGSMQFGWTASEENSLHILDAAFGAGINFIDTADIYSNWVEGNPGGVSESIIGRWLGRSPSRRQEVVIATKVRGKMGGSEGLSRAHILQAVESSLRRLQVDTIDLYQAHWFDETVLVEETLRTFEDLIRQGKVRFIGASNYPAWRLMQALWVADKNQLPSYMVYQPHYNLLERGEFEQEHADLCAAYGLGVIPYSPLARGFLSGKYQRAAARADGQRNVDTYFDSGRAWAVIDLLEEIGFEKENRCSVSQAALAWLLHQPVVTSPIIGPRTLEQLEDNLGAVDLHLSAEDLKRLNHASEWKAR